MLSMAFLILARVSSAPLLVDADADLPRAAVHYGDLNLASPQGRERLASRVRHAAIELCGDRYVRNLEQKTAVERCWADVMNSAKPQVDVAVNHAHDSTAYVAAATLVISQK